MSLKNTLAGAASFAHLFGLSPAAARADDGEEDETKGNRADGDQGDNKTPEDDEQDGKKDGKKGKRAKADEGDDEAEEDTDEKKEARARGVRSERKRCAAIFASAAAGVRPDVAAQLAFGTNLSAAEAIGVLGAAAAGSAPRSTLASRMDSVHVPKIGSETSAKTQGEQSDAQSAAQVAAQAILAARAKVAG